MAPSVVTLMRRMPHTMASISSTKAQVDVSSVAMTSPEGRSVCQRVAEPDQVVVAVGDGAAEGAQRGAPVEPATDAAEGRRGDQHDRVGDDQRPERLPQVLVVCARVGDARPASEAKISGAATALASVPSTMAVQLPAKAARSGCIWRQQYASVALFDAFGKRVRSPMGISRWEGRSGSEQGAPVVRCEQGPARPSRALRPRAVSRAASVAGESRGGPGHAGPPARPHQAKAGGRTTMARAISCGRVSSFLPSGHLASVSWCNPATVATTAKRAGT